MSTSKINNEVRMSVINNNDKQDFIAKYRAAIRAKLSREEFAEYLGVLPDSVIRRRLTVQTTTGLDLPYLDSDLDFDGTISVKKVEEFEEFYKKIVEDHEGPASQDISSNKKKVYVITAAQNATPVHEGFWASLKMYAELRNATIMVIPYRYRNPTSLWSQKSNEAEYWWPSIVDFLIPHEVKICKGLQLLGQIKMQPTAVTPLSGFDGYTGSDSAILGHPKLQLKTVATPSKKMPKILTTTGACTIKNYSDSKAGHKSRFHHNISACIVEVDDDKFHIRHVHGETDGSFYDLEYYYTPHGRTKYGRAAGLVPGDVHAEFVDERVEAALFHGPNSIAETLNPEVLVYHDLEDFYRRNHHHKGDDLIAYGKHHFGRDNVEEGLQVSADFVDKNNRENTVNLIVKSNHDEAFDRWLRDAEPKFDPENARFYYYMKFNQLTNLKRTRTGFETVNAFEFWCHNPLDQRGLQSSDNTMFLRRDQSFEVAGIEISFHGDIGANGSRGSVNAFSKIGPKTIIGHSHSPGIVEGSYQVGVCAYLDLEYAVGPSSWLHTHCIIYPNGSRALINVINGEWRASYYDQEHKLAA